MSMPFPRINEGAVLQVLVSTIVRTTLQVFALKLSSVYMET